LGDLGRDWVFFREAIEQLVQRKNEICILGEGTGLIDQLDPNASARPLLAFGIPGMIDENAPHGRRRRGEEMAAIVELLVADQPKLRLVDERGGIERMPRLLGRYPCAREAS